ncbi:MAG: hypothetical protein RMX65_005640 [Nostoc sp. DedQUE01]
MPAAGYAYAPEYTNTNKLACQRLDILYYINYSNNTSDVHQGVSFR